MQNIFCQIESRAVVLTFEKGVEKKARRHVAEA
jgi:hypothetical protein